MMIWYGMCLSSVIGLAEARSMASIVSGDYHHARARRKIVKFRRDYVTMNIARICNLICRYQDLS